MSLRPGGRRDDGETGAASLRPGGRRDDGRLLPPSPAGRDLVPPGTRLTLHPGVARPGPGVLVGGSPWRILRLSPAGERLVDRWVAGDPVPDSTAARRLAGRLVDSGMAWPTPPPGPTPSVAVVIPVRDRPAGLAATLADLAPDVEVLVVDDGSIDPEATAEALAGHGRARLLRRPQRGPAAARNTGWRATQADVVAFLDADCRPPAGWPAVQLAAFTDPAVAAVAPRITTAADAQGTPAWLATYESVRSPLDLGAAPAPVRPGSTVAYVPTAALAVRRAALEEADGFDEALVAGEDVDLVWRLAGAGWRVRYDPAVSVRHPARPGVTAWVRQRVTYGRSAAPLAARHGDAVAPLVASPWSAAAWGLALAGRPFLGAAVAAASAAALPRKVAAEGTDLPAPYLVRTALSGHLAAGRALAGALRRTWWPLLAGAALCSRRARRAALAVAVVPALVEWAKERPPLGPVAWVGLRLVDDMAYGTGVWAGVVKSGSATCLLPRWV